MKNTVFDVLISFIGMEEEDVRQKALTGLGKLHLESELCLRPDFMSQLQLSLTSLWFILWEGTV